MTVFEVPDGVRVRLEVERVSIVLDGGCGVLEFDAAFEATASDRYLHCPDGVVRRLFVNTSRQFAGHSEIYLSDTLNADSTAVVKGDAGQDVWAEYIDA